MMLATQQTRDVSRVRPCPCHGRRSSARDHNKPIDGDDGSGMLAQACELASDRLLMRTYVMLILDKALMDMADHRFCLLRVPLGGLHSHRKDGESPHVGTETRIRRLAVSGELDRDRFRRLWLEWDDRASRRRGCSLAALRAQRSNQRRNLLLLMRSCMPMFCARE
jgi:hypothetical protein